MSGAAQLGRGLGFSSFDVAELPESRARRAADRCAEEAVGLLALVSPADVLMACDERGRADLSSETLAGARPAPGGMPGGRLSWWRSAVPMASVPQFGRAPT